MRKGIVGAIAVMVVTLVAPVLAHHGGAAYDQTTTVMLNGTMTELQFANPHVLLFFDVTDDKGETTKWSGWLTAPTKLSRAGWTRRTLNPGDKVVVQGRPHKAGSKVVQIQKLIGPDGAELPLFEQ